MKKIVFTTIICLACCAFANAQLGITGGLNLSQYKYISDRDPLITFNAGLLYRSNAKKAGLVLQPMLIYTGKGAIKYTDVDLNSDIDKYINHINYAEFSLPFIASIPIENDDRFRVDFGVGPYAGYIVKATYTAVTYDGLRSTHNYNVGTKNSDDFKPFDAGLSFITGFKIASVAFNLQYDLGLANVNPVTNGAALKMRALMFNTTIYFGK